jgi:hypothetical protein
MLKVEITIKGCIDPKWAGWLGGLSYSQSNTNQTILTGLLPDQAAVYGVISRMRDLGLDLFSVKIETAGKDSQSII